MRIRSIIVFVLCAGAFAIGEVSAQSSKTIVLVRHAERDGTMANNPDPDLSPAGRERAVRLMNQLLAEIRIGAVQQMLAGIVLVARAGRGQIAV